MIIRQTPKNKENYILADCELNKLLTKNGFCPKYIDENGVYYIKSDNILKLINSVKINGIELEH